MISTHILDINLGTPAKDVNVTLEKLSGANWSKVTQDLTNADGRINFECPYEEGQYRLTFEIENYFKKQNLTPFFLAVPVAFNITDTKRKYHVPLLLSPYGYSTYRGS
ncbi:MAG: hydroxyisourate hydrolase [Bdellovibrionaceae bacterium]|jgi:5-hydroxyisourate hydrolase|nr:hydroxyisourate hydrolase [Pseudobdellovibrionaceae bacterium]